FPFSAQPITLTITNAVRAGSANATYSVEVASDAGFSKKVFSKDGIAEGSGGSTNVSLSSLDGGTTYYLPSAAVIGCAQGVMSPTRAFTVQPNIVFSPPGANNPGNGGTASDTRPTFTVTNATHTGPAASVAYEFQVATSSSFQTILASSGAVPEQSNGITS